ncbi:hypothetical protein ACFQLX_25440 [Streptomyces polyrhachis]|uniref:Uncharacterized protein n=1 Tax=Streptomyces polyrhachis TaxID=1282885 RepID=A0ABW2GL49_9ACTN
MDDLIAASERFAREIRETRLAEGAFAARLAERCRVWAVDRDALLAQTESVIVIALIAAADPPKPTQAGRWRADALARLLRREDVPLFAALPRAQPAGLALRVNQLRLLSTGLTSRSALRWERLVVTAGEFLSTGAPPPGPPAG